MNHPEPSGTQAPLAYSKPTLMHLSHQGIDMKSRTSVGEFTTTGPNQQYLYAPS